MVKQFFFKYGGQFLTRYINCKLNFVQNGTSLIFPSSSIFRSALGKCTYVHMGVTVGDTVAAARQRSFAAIYSLFTVFGRNVSCTQESYFHATTVLIRSVGRGRRRRGGGSPRESRRRRPRRDGGRAEGRRRAESSCQSPECKPRGNPARTFPGPSQGELFPVGATLAWRRSSQRSPPGPACP